MQEIKHFYFGLKKWKKHASKKQSCGINHNQLEQ